MQELHQHIAKLLEIDLLELNAITERGRNRMVSENRSIDAPETEAEKEAFRAIDQALSSDKTPREAYALLSCDESRYAFIMYLIAQSFGCDHEFTVGS